MSLEINSEQGAQELSTESSHPNAGVSESQVFTQMRNRVCHKPRKETNRILRGQALEALLKNQHFSHIRGKPGMVL